MFFSLSVSCDDDVYDDDDDDDDEKIRRVHGHRHLRPRDVGRRRLRRGQGSGEDQEGRGVRCTVRALVDHAGGDHRFGVSFWESQPLFWSPLARRVQWVERTLGPFVLVSIYLHPRICLVFNVIFLKRSAVYVCPSVLLCF